MYSEVVFVHRGGGMDVGKSVFVGVFACLLGATPVWAQAERGFVRGLGGVTFGTAEVSSIFGGGAVIQRSACGTVPAS